MATRKQPTGPQFTAWSQSRFEDYGKCPCYAKLKHLMPEYKGRDVGGAAMQRGSRIHEAAAGYIAGHTAKLDPDLKHPRVAKSLRALRKGYVEHMVWVELMLCFDKDWHLLKDKWSPLVWLRVKVDVVDLRDPDEAVIWDWKTGRFRPDADCTDQIELYSIAALSAYTQPRARAHLMFTDCGDVMPENAQALDRGALNPARAEWERRLRPMFADRWFTPTPGPHCQWCCYSRNEGGPCDF